MKAELGDKEAALSKEAQDVMRKIFKSRLEEYAAQSPVGGEFAKANQKYSQLAGLRPLIEKAEEDAARLNMFGLTDSIAGVGAGAARLGSGGDLTESALFGLGSAIGTKLAKNFGPSLAAYGGVKGGRALESLSSKNIPDPIKEKLFQGIMDYFESQRNKQSSAGK